VTAAAADPFGTAELRRRVLDAWRDSPARFRADANLTDDLALVGYRDRVVVELAQNAADAADRAGEPGRLLVDLTGDVLTVANTGTPLDAAGVESISVSRASAKREQAGAVGRFGVGFAAVLSVSDAPVIASRTGAVTWSLTAALDAVAAVPELASEVGVRAGRLPVLRLPFAAAGSPPAGFDTAVVLPLRDAAALAEVRRQLDALDDALLLSLPSLGDVVVRVDGAQRGFDQAGVASRWHVARASGSVDAALLAGQPAEDRRDDGWQVSWAIPVDAGRVTALPTTTARVVRAPTPTDDPLTLDAVLVASYPLDATRRRVVPGPLAAAVTDRAAEVLVAALLDLPPHPGVLGLVPTGLPDGPVDAELHAAVLEQLRERPWLPSAGDPDIRLRPGDVVSVDDGLVDALLDVVPALLPAGWSHPALVALGVRRPSIAELVDAVGEVRREPAWWARLYAALDATVPPGNARDALGALAVPLADGTVVTGPRGVTLPVPGTPAAELAVLGLRVVDPAAAHPLLRSLGAVEGTARGLLEQTRVRAAVEASYDAEDPEPVAAAVLSLVSAVDPAPGELPWLAELALPDGTGEWRPAGELLLPDGWMAAVVAADSPFGAVDAGWVSRWGSPVLAAVGVLDGPAVLRELDAVGPDHDLDDEADWWAGLPDGAAVAELVAVRDLELVADDAWPAGLEMLADPSRRSAVVDPAVVLLPDGGRVRVSSYTAWWLGRHPVIGDRLPSQWRLPGADPLLRALYDEAPAAADRELLLAIGVLDALDDADPADVLERLADPARTITREELRAWARWLAAADPGEVPSRIRAVRDGEVVVVDAADAVIVDAPDLLPLLGNRAIVPVTASAAADLADRLDLPLATELADYAVVSAGKPDGHAVVHDGLRVRDADGEVREVVWRLVDDVLHVDRDSYAVGLGRGLAWRDGLWSQRHRRTEELGDLVGGRIMDDEDDLDDE
jgi:hypothetical protein